MYDDDGFDDDERRQPTAKDLRDLVKKANDRAAELEKQNAALSNQIATRNLKDVLTEKGLRPGLARLIAKEDVDLTDPKAIETWLTDPDNQEDFGFSLDATPEGGGKDGDAVNGGEQDARAEQYARMQNAGQNAAPSGPGTGAANAIKSATSVEEINAAIAAGLAQSAQ
jgi:hypothetical protein